MRSLALKLTLAFLLVGLIGAVVVSILVQLRTRRAFDSFLTDQYQSSLVTELTQYYEENGSWQDVVAVFQSGEVGSPGNQADLANPENTGGLENYNPGGSV